jgi:aminopeptidase N
MENWGLNTYRTIYLIWKEGINTQAEKFRIANIIGHELAHQYWGNLVRTLHIKLIW